MFSMCIGVCHMYNNNPRKGGYPFERGVTQKESEGGYLREAQEWKGKGESGMIDHILTKTMSFFLWLGDSQLEGYTTLQSVLAWLPGPALSSQVDYYV